LVADHLDRQVGRRRRILVAQQPDRRDRDRDQDQHRDQRPDDLDRVLCELRDGVGLAPRRKRTIA
jgi:hypothetical protein